MQTQYIFKAPEQKKNEQKSDQRIKSTTVYSYKIWLGIAAM